MRLTSIVCLSGLFLSACQSSQQMEARLAAADDQRCVEMGYGAVSPMSPTASEQPTRTKRGGRRIPP